MRGLLNLAIRLGIMMFEVGHKKIQENHLMARVNSKCCGVNNLFKVHFENKSLDSQSC